VPSETIFDLHSFGHSSYFFDELYFVWIHSFYILYGQFELIFIHELWGGEVMAIPPVDSNLDLSREARPAFHMLFVKKNINVV
jgi:hypothetical protein